MWQIPTLKPDLKNLILSTSANTLKICTPTYTLMTSYHDLHTQNTWATPNQFMIYKHSLLLYSIYNTQSPTKDWIDLNFNQNFNTREPNFRTLNRNNYRVGKNKISERLNILNGKIPWDWLNQDKLSYKLKCKSKFLPAQIIQSLQPSIRCILKSILWKLFLTYINEF